MRSPSTRPRAPAVAVGRETGTIPRVSPTGEPVEIKVRDNGPYKVTGPVRVIDAEGGEFEIEPGETVVLCRCGHSRTKPFCDSSHKSSGFEACERAPAREA